MVEKLIHIFKAFLDVLFPSKCVGCGAKNEIFCQNCLELLPYPENYPWNTPNTPNTRGRSSGLIFAATSYKDESVKKAIRMFKYHGIKILAKPLAELILKRTKNDLSKLIKNPDIAALIPIPLSKKRLRQRGYNQSELLGQFLSDKLSIKMETNVLYKIKETISQVEIKDREKRLKNLQGAFKVKNPELIKNKIVILVDDISTTGATLNEAKQVLMQAGAKKVIGLVVAKG